MKNNPLLQLVKLLVGASGTVYFGYKLVGCFDPYITVVWLLLTVFCLAIGMHGWLKFRGEEN